MPLGPVSLWGRQGLVGHKLRPRFDFVSPSLIFRSQSWLDEWLWTFLLVLVVFSVASSKRDSNAFFGLAIGCVVLAGDSFFDTYSKGFFNPGVGTGVCLLSVFEKKGAYALWIYWVSGPDSRGLLLLARVAGGWPTSPSRPLVWLSECVYVMCLCLAVQTACPFGGVCAAYVDKFMFPDDVPVIDAPAATTASPPSGAASSGAVGAGAGASSVPASTKEALSGAGPHHRLEDEDEGPAYV
jgi:hypothetical protein